MNASGRLPDSIPVPPNAVGRLPDALPARPRPDDSGIVQTGGQARPEVSMSKESSATKVARAESVATGLRTLFGPREKVWAEGEAGRSSDVIALFDSHAAAIRDKDARYRAYLFSVAAEKALARQTNAVW